MLTKLKISDLPAMTEDLWHHALQFLDKYRADALHYPIEELYQFADQTGILERHRQLLAKPFHDHEVRYCNRTGWASSTCACRWT